MRHSALLLASAAMPLAIAGGRVSADAPDPVALIGQINAAVTTMRANQQALEDDFATFRASMLLGGGGGGMSTRPDDPEYSASFNGYFRSGRGEDAVQQANATGNRAQIRAAMSVGSNSDGGYLAPTEWDRRINQAQVALSPMRRLASVQQTSVGAYSTLWNNAQWGSGWVGETAARPTTTTATLSPITFPTGEIYANPTATQRILDDGLIDVAGWLGEQVATEFSRQEGIAFVSGDGVNKPAGFLTYAAGGVNAATHPGGPIATVATGVAAALGNADTLVDFVYGLPAPYRQNASWLMNSGTAAVIAKMKDGQGNYIWRESLIVGQPATLLGRPVEIDENMPAIAAGNLPIAFGDFAAGYLINDRQGVRILRDPYTAKPFVLFYTTKRVGGGVLDPLAIRLMRVAAA